MIRCLRFQRSCFEHLAKFHVSSITLRQIGSCLVLICFYHYAFRLLHRNHCKYHCLRLWRIHLSSVHGFVAGGGVVVGRLLAVGKKAVEAKLASVASVA